MRQHTDMPRSEHRFNLAVPHIASVPNGEAGTRLDDVHERQARKRGLHGLTLVQLGVAPPQPNCPIIPLYGRSPTMPLFALELADERAGPQSHYPVGRGNGPYPRLLRRPWSRAGLVRIVLERVREHHSTRHDCALGGSLS